MKEVNLLSKGLFNNKLLDSRVKTRAVTRKEKILGHLVGPLGLIFIVNTIAALVEKFFMQQVGLVYPGGADGAANPLAQAMGDKYQLVVMIARFLMVGMGLVNGWLISHTKSRQGRLRPWFLIFSFMLVIIGVLIFLFSPNIMGEAYWVYFFVLLTCYHAVGTTFFYAYRDSIVSLITRDPREKAQISFMRKMCWTLISGIIIGLIVQTVLIPFWLQDHIEGYAILLIVLSVCAVPLILMEYYYTKERVVEDVNKEAADGNASKVPLKAQLKALFTNRFYVILIVLVTLQGVLDNFKGGNVQYYYVQYLLGGVENPAMQTIYSIVTGVPMGIGAIAIYPLAKKFGIKNVTIGGYALVLIGSLMGFFFPDVMVPAIIGGFLRNLGWLPNSYIFITLLYYAYDDIEFRSGIRVEGLMGVGIVVALQNLAYAPVAGGYESLLLNMGFVDNLEVMPDPPENVKDFMSMSFYLFDAILAATFLILLPFVNVEKKLPKINSELMRRKKEAVLAKGEVWIEPAEQDRIEREEAERVHEENRIADLKELCAKKGLDFETENAKYLAAEAEKKRKWEEKQAAKAAKRKAKLEEKNRKRAAKGLPPLKDDGDAFDRMEGEDEEAVEEETMNAAKENCGAEEASSKTSDEESATDAGEKAPEGGEDKKE